MDLETLFHLIELQPEMIEKLEAAAQTLPPLPKSFPQSLLSRYAADAYSELKAALGDLRMPSSAPYVPPTTRPVRDRRKEEDYLPSRELRSCA